MVEVSADGSTKQRGDTLREMEERERERQRYKKMTPGAYKR
jgi:hypothetical protein